MGLVRAHVEPGAGLSRVGVIVSATAAGALTTAAPMSISDAARKASSLPAVDDAMHDCAHAPDDLAIAGGIYRRGVTQMAHCSPFDHTRRSCVLAPSGSAAVKILAGRQGLGLAG